ncbi:hypothetical protein DUI87_13253 [Hirundo rustica rustica]|uniref:Uncharacterized protein n=1 Tax=Hirundo rustica rustica TaxID=333673 RepID=A0A3M0KBB9_HIRRU|nr:hypothetical protein DUI87_13253 [Hirundo rustica rustica]
MEEKKTEAAPAVCLQPSTAAASSIKHGGERDGEEMFKGSRRSDKQSRASSSSSNHTAAQAVPATTQPSVFAAKELSQEVIALCTHIPRPSIIHVPKVSSALEVPVKRGWMLGKAFSHGGQCSMGGGHTEVMGMLCLKDYKTWLDKSWADLAYPWQPSGLRRRLEKRRLEAPSSHHFCDCVMSGF